MAIGANDFEAFFGGGGGSVDFAMGGVGFPAVLPIPNLNLRFFNEIHRNKAKFAKIVKN
jgi:hypothetical protein